MRFLALIILATALIGLHAESIAVTEIKNSIQRMETKAAEVKDNDVVAYSTLTNAIKDLHKYIDDTGVEGSRLLITLQSDKNMKRLFKAPCRVNKETGETALAYAWNDPALIQDFDLGGTKPSYKGDALIIPAAGKLTHKAQWLGNVTISGKINMLNRTGVHISASGNWAVEGHNYNAWIIGILSGKTLKAEQTFSHDYTVPSDGKFVPFAWEINATRVGLTFADVNLGVPSNGAFTGQLALCGGSGGNQFRDIVITGTLDTNWLKQTLGIGAP